jgi:signal transduction histidine kinase
MTVVWSMVASAYLLLAAMYFLIWWTDRGQRAPLLFAINAGSIATFAACELWMTHAATPDALQNAIRFANVPLSVWLVSTVWFVMAYLGTGRRWLAWSILIARALLLIANFQPGRSLTFAEMAPIQHSMLLGEAITVPAGVRSPWLPVANATTVLILVFLVDATMAAWRRGDRRKALLVGGSAQFALLASFLTALPVVWGGAPAPFIFSLPYLPLAVVMGYELSRGILRESQLVDELQASEAALRENQSRLLASHQQISDLFGRLIAAQETERARIARDLHDDVGQRLAGISIAISSLKRKLSARSQDAAVAALTTMQLDATALADEIRHVSHELHPTLLQHAGLVSALESVCTQFGKRRQIGVIYRADPNLGPLDNETATALFRVTQEALHNVAKHAGARHVSVTLAASAGLVRLSIADDGKGFDLAEARARSSGLGLLSIDERVRPLKGKVEITTKPKGGTVLVVEVPA